MMRKYLLIATAVVLMSGSARAEENTNIIGGDCSKTTDDHCSWSYDTTTGALTISGTGQMENYKSITIEGTQEYGYNHYSGKTSYSSAPWGKYQVNSITIADGIENIGNYAFAGANISTIDFPPSVSSLGSYAFYSSKIQSVDIPETVTSFSVSIFEQCASLTDVILPDNMTHISSWMFASAKNLADIEIPESVELIVNGAFKDTKIESLIIPASVTELSEMLFSYKDGKNMQADYLQHLYCTKEQALQCQKVLTNAQKDFAPTIYEKRGNDYLVYDEKGNIVGKYTSAMNLSKGMATETYKYDSAGHLVGIFDGNGQRTWGKKIYTVEEAMEVTKNGDKFHVYLTYK